MIIFARTGSFCSVHLYRNTAESFHLQEVTFLKNAAKGETVIYNAQLRPYGKSGLGEPETDGS
jgi:hypothetical protein